MKKDWREELKTLLKENRSASKTGGSGEMYWNSVIRVIEKFARRNDKALDATEQ